MSRESDVAALIASCVDRFGRLDCAVNNAATEPDTGMIHEADEKVFDRIIAINLKAVLLCMKHELAQMLRQEDRGGLRMRGSIVNISSISGLRPQTSNPARSLAATP